MADCSYARCVQERRFIKRELQKWTKSMVYIVGLERAAEELMGRRKWKLYQDILTSSTHHQLSAHHQHHPQQQNQTNTTTATAAQQPDTNLAVNNISTGGKDVFTEKNNGQLVGPLEGDLLSKLEEVAAGSPAAAPDKVDATTSYTTAEPANCNNIGGKLKEILEDKDRIAIETHTSDLETNFKKNGEKKVAFTEAPEEPPACSTEPVDWKPQDKCYFCVDGKLLAVNDRGDLVPESGSGNTEPELLTTTPIDSDSDSSENCSEIGNPNLPNATSRAVKDLLRNPNMTSLESVVAQYAAVASMHGLPAVPGLAQFYPGLWYSPSFSQNLQENAESSSNAKPANNEGASPVPNAEQPLDLSAKSSSSSSSSLDQKNIFKAKPRMTAISGRRTYTEDELQNALQDILSGKLGTRRAAVLYGIPRSTLRNKVYKLAIEQKREANMNQPVLHAPVLADLEDDDKDGSGAEDEKELEKTLHSLPSEDILRLTATQSLAALQKFGKFYEINNQDSPSDMSTPPPKQSPIPMKSRTPTLQSPLLDPSVFFQSLILSGGLGALTGLGGGGGGGGKSEDNPSTAAMAELFRNFLLQQELLKNSEGRVAKSETPETASVDSMGRCGSDVNDTNDDPSVILKIPSFKPVVGSSSTTVASISSAINKNGDNAPNSSQATPILARSPHQQNQQHHQQQQHNLLGMSSPVLRQSSESQSPPIPNLGSVSLRDVIAKKISINFQSSLPIESSKNDHQDGGSSIMDHYKWPSISVKKGLGAEMNRFGSGSSLLGGNSSLNSALNNTGTGGKGTRPKRGKYRNYDRDSLVEAVKAVQRGEMSVHRAGSYYGVPHSTLEYKVKERHLMRPRKREPKPQPIDDRNTNSSSSPVTNTKSSDIPSSSNVRSALDKGKLVSPASAKPPLKTPPFSSTTSPNGLKMPFVDPSMAAQLQYNPHLFWPHPPNFSGMPMEFPRTPGSSSSSSTFPPNTPDTFFASQMMQRFQEDSQRKPSSTNSSSHNSNSSKASAANCTGGLGKGGSAVPTMSNSSFGHKTARELAESLYDGTNVNGSFLDGIIRHSLDRKPGDIQQGALLDQLVKNSLPLSSKHKPNDANVKGCSSGLLLGGPGSLKRSGSPLNFATEIKKERDSPLLESNLGSSQALNLNSRQARDGIDNGPVENLIKLREGIQERTIEDFNGSNNRGGGDNETLANKSLLMSSENEDSS